MDEDEDGGGGLTATEVRYSLFSYIFEKKDPDTMYHTSCTAQGNDKAWNGIYF